MTVSSPSQKFLNNLNMFSKKVQRERENMLSLLTSAVSQITRAREERDNAFAHLEDMNRKYQAVSEHALEVEKQNERLERDLQAMMAAMDAASRQFADDESILTDRVVALGSELNIPSSEFTRQSDPLVRSEAVSKSSQPVSRRAVVRGAAVSPLDESSDEIEKSLRDVMGQLKSIINEKRPVNII